MNIMLMGLLVIAGMASSAFFYREGGKVVWAKQMAAIAAKNAELADLRTDLEAERQKKSETRIQIVKEIVEQRIEVPIPGKPQIKYVKTPCDLPEGVVASLNKIK